MNPSLAITITLYSRFSTSSFITPKTLFISIESTTLSKSSRHMITSFGISLYIPNSVSSIYFSNGSLLRTLNLDLNPEYNYYNSNGEWMYLENYNAPNSDTLPNLPSNILSSSYSLFFANVRFF